MDEEYFSYAELTEYAVFGQCNSMTPEYLFLERFASLEYALVAKDRYTRLNPELGFYVAKRRVRYEGWERVDDV